MVASVDVEDMDLLAISQLVKQKIVPELESVEGGLGIRCRVNRRKGSGSTGRPRLRDKQRVLDKVAPVSLQSEKSWPQGRKRSKREERNWSPKKINRRPGSLKGKRL